VDVVESLDDAGLKTLKKLTDRKTMPPERDNWIDRQLARAMNEASTAAIHPADLNLPVADQAALHGDLARRATSADGDDRCVLAKQKDDLPIVAVSALDDQPLLEGQHPIKGTLPQQKRLHGR
jgi:hypothetical protein